MVHNSIISAVTFRKSQVSRPIVMSPRQKKKLDLVFLLLQENALDSALSAVLVLLTRDLQLRSRKQQQPPVVKWTDRCLF